MKRIKLAISVRALAIGAGVAEAQVSDDVVKIGVLNDQSGLYADVSGHCGTSAFFVAGVFAPISEFG